ncbi:MAG: LPS assembly lipoprotein LptE, partial [Gammaproteobacteria bacterium]|nr:LPS assembly lipoprotein LptE [Gammaproteobacteria bacterium]
MDTTYVRFSGQEKQLLRETIRQLALSGVEVVGNPGQASAILSIDRSTVRRDVLSTDRRGRAQEYAINVSIRFRLVGQEGNDLFGPEEVSSQAVLALDPSNPTANRSELENTVASLQADAVSRMLRLVSSAEVSRPLEESIPEE